MGSMRHVARAETGFCSFIGKLEQLSEWFSSPCIILDQGCSSPIRRNFNRPRPDWIG